MQLWQSLALTFPSRRERGNQLARRGEPGFQKMFQRVKSVPLPMNRP